MSFAPTLHTVIEPWFDKYADTLKDATTFRHLIHMLDKELGANRELEVALRGRDELQDEYVMVLKDVIAAEDMRAKLVTRLNALTG